MPEAPSFIESLRQQAVIGIIIGIRQGIANATVAVSPLGDKTVRNDERAALQLLAQGDFERAFEVATGFAEYFDIYKQGKANGATGGEIGGTMVGQATGFNQAIEALKGESRSGNKLSGTDRISAGMESLTKLVSVALTVAGGVELAELALKGPGTVVSPVYRIAGRDVVIVETSAGRQAFYRSTGRNSKHPGKWYPVDEFWPKTGTRKAWFNKGGYTQGPGLEDGKPLHRLGNLEFAEISKKLGEMSIPEGQQVPAGKTEAAEMTLNRILDFFGARNTPTTVVRPVPE
jgi:hypothetical protein